MTTDTITCLHRALDDACRSRDLDTLRLVLLQLSDLVEEQGDAKRAAGWRLVAERGRMPAPSANRTGEWLWRNTLVRKGEKHDAAQVPELMKLRGYVPENSPWWPCRYYPTPSAALADLARVYAEEVT